MPIQGIKAAFPDCWVETGVFEGTKLMKLRERAADVSLPLMEAATIYEHGTIKYRTCSSVQSPILSRELLSTGEAAALVINHEPWVRLLTDAEREASRVAFMHTRPSCDLWVFGYGSLMWNPALRVAEHRVARIVGWHRSFCLTMAVGRGTPDQPGLVLGLDRGGTCHGVAFRIDEQDIVTELPILWNREMLLGGYDPTWVDVIGDNGQTFASAIAFTIDRDHEHYANGLSHQERILRLANAVGSWGSSADYLFRTIYGLHSNGIRDEEMERLGYLVEAERARRELVGSF